MFIFYEAIKVERYDCNSMCLFANLCTHLHLGWAWSLWHQLPKLFVCSHIKGLERSETIQLRLENPCQCKQNSYQFERNIDFYITFLFPPNLQRCSTEKSLLHLNCFSSQFRKMSSFKLGLVVFSHIK